MSAFLSTVFSMEMLVAIWETFYITILATAFALLLGNPRLFAAHRLGVLALGNAIADDFFKAAARFDHGG